MSDHTNQTLTTREMVRVHAIPVLAAISSLSLLTIAVLLVPQAMRHHRFNRCVDAQISMRDAINAGSQKGPGRMNELKAFEHCHGR